MFLKYVMMQNNNNTEFTRYSITSHKKHYAYKCLKVQNAIITIYSSKLLH